LIARRQAEINGPLADAGNAQLPRLMVPSTENRMPVGFPRLGSSIPARISMGLAWADYDREGGLAVWLRVQKCE
jgi:hypothetical protein